MSVKPPSSEPPGSAEPSAPVPPSAATPPGADLHSVLAQLERARRSAEAANQSKSLFLANIVHEIRTPMNAILGYGQLLLRAPDIPSKYRNALETIEKSGAHLLELINDVLDLSKIEAGCMELHPIDFDLNALLYELSAMFDVRCQQKRLGWRVEIWHPPSGPLARKVDAAAGRPAAVPSAQAPPAPPQHEMEGWRLMVHGDERKLRQILINLLSNAVKFTTQGEMMLKVILPAPLETARPAPDDDAALDSSAPPGDSFYFEVSDTGPGISPETIASLFQPFHQGVNGRKMGGTGLGLAISTRLVSLMGGELRLESHPGKGCRFWFSIPLAPVQSEGGSSAAQVRVRRLRAGFSLKALVVDDVVENREVLRALLSDLGCDVRTAESALQALSLVPDQRPDVIFLDVRMPEMGGLEATGHIQSRLGSECPKLIAFSASALMHEQQQYLSGGFDAVIAKPFRLERVCETLEQLLPVKFDYVKAPERAPAVLAPRTWGEIRLPQELHRRLKAAAEVYGTTELKRCLAEVDALGGAERQFAARIRELLLSYDMEAILDLLAAAEPAA